jgi:hypothetical protein
MAGVKKFLALSLMILLLVSTCACGHKLTEGEVYDKEFMPARTQVMMIPIVHSNGKTSTTTIIPYVYYYPDRWLIRIREPNGDGTYITDEYYTSKEVYDSVNIGDTFSYDPDRDFENEPYTRARQRKGVRKDG